jgi:hypothetical protein
MGVAGAAAVGVAGYAGYNAYNANQLPGQQAGGIVSNIQNGRDPFAKKKLTYKEQQVRNNTLMSPPVKPKITWAEKKGCWVPKGSLRCGMRAPRRCVPACACGVDACVHGWVQVRMLCDGC